MIQNIFTCLLPLTWFPSNYHLFSSEIITISTEVERYGLRNLVISMESRCQVHSKHINNHQKNIWYYFTKLADSLSWLMTFFKLKQVPTQQFRMPSLSQMPDYWEKNLLNGWRVYGMSQPLLLLLVFTKQLTLLPDNRCDVPHGLASLNHTTPTCTTYIIL